MPREVVGNGRPWDPKEAFKVNIQTHLPWSYVTWRRLRSSERHRVLQQWWRCSVDRHALTVTAWQTCYVQNVHCVNNAVHKCNGPTPAGWRSALTGALLVVYWLTDSDSSWWCHRRHRRVSAAFSRHGLITCQHTCYDAPYANHHSRTTGIHRCSAALAAISSHHKADELYV